MINGAGRERGAIGMKNITAADLFCGGGGTSQGLIRAAREMGINVNLLAVNHWPVAVETHALNHPGTRHLCADLGSVDPNKAMDGGRLDLLVASPECTHHSIARGGKPCSDQSRASAWHVVHWAERLEPREILVENVREFEGWGPLLKRQIRWRGKTYKKGRPDPRHKGETFQAWANALRSLGYILEYRVLNAADFGDATSRRRLFVRASRTGKIRWPSPTHAGRWRGAREIIDWSLRSQSIFNRKKPLRPTTLRRIEAGLKKFGGEKFIVLLRGTSDSHEGSWSRSMDAPLPVISAGGVHAGVCEPFLVEYHGNRGSRNERVKSLEQPLPVQTAENRFGLCQPFVTKYYGTGTVQSVEEPLDTVTAHDRFGLVEPGRMDIYFRMLQPHELARAMGFDDGYVFCGTKSDKVRQIGNAVAVRTAAALCGEILRGMI